MPSLTVIMPVFNAGPALTTAVASTLAALPPDAELLAVDDASSDGSLDLLHDLAARRRRLRVIANPVNLGVAGSLQRLLDESDSTWVARMDADDIMLPWRLRVQLRSVTAGPQQALFSTVLRYVPERHRIWPQRVRTLTPEVAPYVLLLTNPFVHSTLCVPRTLLGAVGGYRDVPSEDYDLWMRLVLAGHPVRRLAVPTVVYRHHPGQLTSGTGWISRARDNEQTSAVHAELAERLLGWTEPVFAAMRGDLGRADDVALVGEFVDRVAARAGLLGADGTKPLIREIDVWRSRLAQRRES